MPKINLPEGHERVSVSWVHPWRYTQKFFLRSTAEKEEATDFDNKHRTDDGINYSYRRICLGCVDRDSERKKNSFSIWSHKRFMKCVWVHYRCGFLPVISDFFAEAGSFVRLFDILRSHKYFCAAGGGKELNWKLNFPNVVFLCGNFRIEVFLKVFLFFVHSHIRTLRITIKSN